MIKIKNLFFVILIGILFNGCSTSMLNEDLVTPKNNNERTNFVELRPEKKNIDYGEEINGYVHNSNSDILEKELIRIASKTQSNYNKFYHLLKQRKEIEKQKGKKHIPKNMGKRLSITFEGYSGVLLKKLVEKVGYNLISRDINLQNTKIIHRDYTNTMISDMLEDIVIGNGFNIIINEKEKIVIMYAEE